MTTTAQRIDEAIREHGSRWSIVLAEEDARARERRSAPERIEALVRVITQIGALDGRMTCATASDLVAAALDVVICEAPAPWHLDPNGKLAASVELLDSVLVRIEADEMGREDAKKMSALLLAARLLLAEWHSRKVAA